MTYSIVARDSSSNQMGVAAQSHHISVGAHVAAARAGVGVMAVQSFADRRYVEEGLGLLADGVPPEEAVLGLLEGHERGYRRAQFAILSPQGGVAAHTGGLCVEYAGHQVGEDVSAQANMVRSDHVWTSMIEVFTDAGGDLASRLMCALEAGERAGGDWRGQQSAALSIVPINAPEGPRPVIDLRVDDSTEPLVELRRLDRLRRASDLMGTAIAAAGEGRLDEAIEMLDHSRDQFGADNREPDAWAAVLLIRAGQYESATRRLTEAARTDEGWLEFMARLPAAGLLPADDERLRDVLDRAREK